VLHSGHLHHPEGLDGLIRPALKKPVCVLRVFQTYFLAARKGGPSDRLSHNAFMLYLLILRKLPIMTQASALVAWPCGLKLPSG